MATHKMGSVKLTSIDDLFTTQEERDDAKQPKIKDIPLLEIHDFPDHPFRVVQDEAMLEMVQSVKEYGVLSPATVRPRKEGGYELISGHRRKLASALAGLDSMPCIIQDLTDDEAIIVMVDANLQREQILPSEKAKAYKMKLDAMRRKQGARTDLTSVQVGQKLSDATSVQIGQRLNRKTSRELLAENSPDSNTQIQRFIRLTNLIPEIMDLVDSGKIGMTPAVELSYIPQEEQQMVFDAIDSESSTPSLSQAQRLRKMSAAKELNEDTALNVMMEQKKPPLAETKKNDPTTNGFLIPANKVQHYFPGIEPDRIEKMIYNLLDGWLRAQNIALNRQKGKNAPER